jgi:uncharacterized protein YcbX
MSSPCAFGRAATSKTPKTVSAPRARLGPVPIDYTITRLSVTAIKGLSLHHPDSIELTTYGAVGDRLFYLVDDDGALQSCTRNPGLYGLSAAYDRESRRLVVTRGDEVLVAGIAEPASAVDTDMWGLRRISGDTLSDPAWSNFFSDVVGERVHLVQARDSAFDVQPVTLLGPAPWRSWPAGRASPASTRVASAC